jgi:hypothetical protein
VPVWLVLPCSVSPSFAWLTSVIALSFRTDRSSPEHSLRQRGSLVPGPPIAFRHARR